MIYNYKAITAASYISPGPSILTAQPRVYCCFTPGVRSNLKIVFYVTFNNNSKQRKEKEKNPTLLFIGTTNIFEEVACYQNHLALS